MLLHAVLLPPRLSKTEKPTITDAQQDIVTHIVAENNVSYKLEEFVKTVKKIQPSIIVIGPTIETLTDFYTYFDGIMYKLPTFARCLDIVLKICIVFNLEYSKKKASLCGNFFSFIFLI